MHIRLFFDGTVHEGVGYYGYAIEGLLPDGQLTWGCGKVPADYFKEFLPEVAPLHGAIVAIKFLKALPYEWTVADTVRLFNGQRTSEIGYVSAVISGIDESLRFLGVDWWWDIIPRKNNPAFDYVIRAVEQSLPLAEEIVG